MMKAMDNVTFKIDLTELFEHLPKAPIVEAVIHFRARANKKLEPETFLKQLQEKLPDYPNSQRQHELAFGGELHPDGSLIQFKENRWDGYRLETADKLQVAQYTRNGFVFSRLKPYQDWDCFESEALRLWNIYCELTEPREIERLGVRFINSITPIQVSHLSDLLEFPPTSSGKLMLPLKNFMHQNLLEIPNRPYNLNVIQTIQPISPSQSQVFAIILDLDVFTTESMDIIVEVQQERLQEMRWIKNKAFFSLLTPQAIKQFQDHSQ